MREMGRRREFEDKPLARRLPAFELLEPVTDVAADEWRVSASAWPYRETYVTSIGGVRTPLTVTAAGDDDVLRGVPSGKGLHLLLGCGDDVCVIGAAF